jgi:hypothetical protein
MGNILHAAVAVKGTRPLLWHRFGPDSIPLEKAERTGVAGNDPEEWHKTVLATPDGKLYLEPTYIFGCMRDGAKHTARKRGTLQPYIAATLQVTDSLVMTDRCMPEGEPPTDPTAPVYLDVRSVKNPATKARNVRYRIAASDGWNVTFHLMWDKTIVSRSEMQQVAIDAGRFVGLGDGRSVGFGRFEVVSFDVTEE